MKILMLYTNKFIPFCLDLHFITVMNVLHVHLCLQIKLSYLIAFILHMECVFTYIHTYMYFIIILKRTFIPYLRVCFLSNKSVLKCQSAKVLWLLCRQTYLQSLVLFPAPKRCFLKLEGYNLMRSLYCIHSFLCVNTYTLSCQMSCSIYKCHFLKN